MFGFGLEFFVLWFSRRKLINLGAYVRELLLERTSKKEGCVFLSIHFSCYLCAIMIWVSLFYEF